MNDPTPRTPVEDAVPDAAPPAAALAAAAADLERDGVAVIRRVFEPGLMDLARMAALNDLAGADARAEPPEVEFRRHRGQRYPTLLFQPARRERLLAAITRSAAMASIVHRLVGPDARQLNNQVYLRVPGDGDAFAWHQDVMFREPGEAASGVVESYLQTVVLVDAMTTRGGAIHFLPGSHRLGDLGLHDGTAALRDAPAAEALPPAARAIEPVAITGRPGDVVVWNLLTVHGSWPNAGRRARMTYMNGFCRAEHSGGGEAYLSGGQPAGG